jgi:hypothetical protein
MHSVKFNSTNTEIPPEIAAGGRLTTGVSWAAYFRTFWRSPLHDRLKIRPKDGFADYIYEGTLTKICNPTGAI